MNIETCKKPKNGENGNVLFLILIAVALFAALSYAVTSTTRSGSGDASSETNLISSAQVTQYPSSVSTAIVRMIINGNSANAIRFNPPSDFSGNCSNTLCVFHPTGGAATYVQGPADVMVSGSPGDWYFNAHMEVEDIGTTGSGGNDIIAFLPGVKQAICEKINAEHGITAAGVAAPVSDANYVTFYETYMDDAYSFPGSASDIIDDAAVGSNVFAGKPYGCFQNATTLAYVYYHVLVER